VLSHDGKKTYALIPDPKPASRGGTFVERNVATGAERQLFTKPDATGSLHVSPDGRWVTYIRTAPLNSTNPGATTSTVFFHPLEGGPSREAPVPAMLNAYHDVEWMPDGKAIVVPAEVNGKPTGRIVVGAGGRRATQTRHRRPLLVDWQRHADRSKR
jgi:hypothetical protein